jgi:hypothetical protein
MQSIPKAGNLYAGNNVKVSPKTSKQPHSCVAEYEPGPFYGRGPGLDEADAAVELLPSLSTTKTFNFTFFNGFTKSLLTSFNQYTTFTISFLA